MSKAQKRLIVIAVIILVLIIVLAVVIWWQKKVWQDELDNMTLNNSRVVEKQDGKIDDNDYTREADSSDLGKDIIADILPGSDLAEFNLPGEVLNKDYLMDKFVSPAFNRSGKIKQVNYLQSQFIFVDDSLGKEKIYTVKVAENTKIFFDILEDVFASRQAEDPLETKRYSREGSFDELQANDNIRVRAREVIGDDNFISDEIVVKRHIVSFQN